MRHGNGIPNFRFGKIIGIAAKGKVHPSLRHKHIYVGENAGFHSLGFAGCIFSDKGKGWFQPGAITQTDISDIKDGDILLLEDSGTFHNVWQKNSPHNSFFLTGKCNCACLMCPQHPNDVDKSAYDDARKVLNLLQGQKIEHICITGGEPTLSKDNFIHFLSDCVNSHPEALIAVLSNGKNFADLDFVEEIAKVATPNVTFCISLHGDTPRLHDKIVGSQGSFEKTETGLYNLARKGLKIEIRYVITKLNQSRLEQTAAHLYNYFPFCSHYAFMAMEMHADAAKNADIIMAEPYEYTENLANAALLLERGGLNVSIYNVPLCLCEPKVRHLARQSISLWKNIYLKKCENCSRKADCCGFFATSEKLPEEYILPL